MSGNQDITILAVNFSDELVEITYTEGRNQTERAALVNQLLLQSTNHREALAVVLEELRDLVDEGLIELRDPPQRIHPRDRLRESAQHLQVVEEEEVTQADEVDTEREDSE